MKARYIFYLLFFSLVGNAQTARDFAVTLQAEVNESPASITIKWPEDNGTSVTGYSVYRKQQQESSWGNALATLPKTAASYTDNNVSVGAAYEYYVRRTYSQSGRVAHGYIFAGIKAPETIGRGIMLLMVDEHYAVPLAVEIEQLQQDLIGDGWQIKRHTISRTASVASVKSIIANEYKADAATKAVYLLGRIPVPYSGSFSPGGPDGHTDHGGAWPADMYYASMDESIWTDTDVNDTEPSRPENDNIPGDGKFDRVDLYPYEVQLQVGRVDLTNMSQFGSNDTLRMKRYLDRAHGYKTGQLPVVKRALVDDHFGAFSGEAFASSGWRNFSTMFGDSVFSGDYLTSAKEGNYQFVYACGPGSYTSCGGVGVSADFDNDSLDAFFTMMFGSYFGDWDSPNNFLRAPLCSKQPALASMWSGRPYWNLHHMSLGEHIGYAARLTQNNIYTFNTNVKSGYSSNFYTSYIHIALMGDPSLRLHPLKQVTDLHATASGDSMNIHLAWSSSPDAEGYFVLHASRLEGPYHVNAKLGLSDTTYHDAKPYPGQNYYMVRALKLEHTPSGSYYNQAIGIIDSAYSTNMTGLRDEQDRVLNVYVYPNPGNGKFRIWKAGRDALSITCFDYTGRLLFKEELNRGEEEIDLTSHGKGIYFMKISDGRDEVLKRVIVY